MSRIPQIGRTISVLPERTLNSSHPSIQSFIGSAVVVLSAAFFVLTLGEGKHNPYQPFIDSVLHSWMAMAIFAFALWAVRRDWFGPVPAFLRLLAGLLFLFFLLSSAVALVVWAPLWNFLRLLQVSQKQVQPIAGFAVVGIWFLTCLAVLLVRFIRWMGKRYQHHGFAIGFGPLYFYFKRRRAS